MSHEENIQVKLNIRDKLLVEEPVRIYRGLLKLIPRYVFYGFRRETARLTCEPEKLGLKKDNFRDDFF